VVRAGLLSSIALFDHSFSINISLDDYSIYTNGRSLPFFRLYSFALGTAFVTGLISPQSLRLRA